ncbi:hypothetical protein ES705_33015 [subsurface metagenome]
MLIKCSKAKVITSLLFAISPISADTKIGPGGSKLLGIFTAISAADRNATFIFDADRSAMFTSCDSFKFMSISPT